MGPPPPVPGCYSKKKVLAQHHLPPILTHILCYQGVHMQDKERTESTGKIWFFLFIVTILNLKHINTSNTHKGAKPRYLAKLKL